MRQVTSVLRRSTKEQQLASSAPEWLASVKRERDAILLPLVADFEAAREVQNLTVAALARRAGLSKRGLINLRLARCDPRLSSLVATARALGRRLVITLTPVEAEHAGVTRANVPAFSQGDARYSEGPR